MLSIVLHKKELIIRSLNPTFTRTSTPLTAKSDFAVGANLEEDDGAVVFAFVGLAAHSVA